jgi:hypothetical protein
MRYTEKKLLSPSDQNSHTKMALARSFHVNFLEQKFCWDGTMAIYLNQSWLIPVVEVRNSLAVTPPLAFPYTQSITWIFPLYFQVLYLPQEIPASGTDIKSQEDLYSGPSPTLHKLMVLATSSLIVRKEQ